MWPFKRKPSLEEEVRELVIQHLDVVGKCVTGMATVMENYIKFIDGKLSEQELKDSSYAVHRLESKADDIRKAIFHKIAKGAFMAYYREDFVHLAESIDFVAGRAEAVADFIVLQRPYIPSELREELLELVGICSEAVEPLKQGFLMLYKDLDKALEYAGKVDLLESRADRVEWHLLKKIFASQELDLAQKIHLKSFVKDIGIVADAMENVSDLYELIAIRRKL